MDQVEQWANRYARFRRGGRLRQAVWQETQSSGHKIACALGAFLDVGGNDILNDDADRQAVKKACITGKMPEWLVNLTPAYFDQTYTRYSRNYHLLWADALYMPGGCIDRANKLPEDQRKALYAAAEKEIMERFTCHLGSRPRDFNMALIMGEEADKDNEVAGTIPTVLDELLTKAGV